MNKKGLIGKILLIIGIVFLIILLIAGFTAWQVYGLYKTSINEKAKIDESMKGLQEGNCSKAADLEASIIKIESRAKSACRNPIINFGVAKMQQIPIKCANLSEAAAQMKQPIQQIKDLCANSTMLNATAHA